MLGVSPDIDLFASQLNHQFERYVSFRPDPNACMTDAFSMPWNGYSIYCFPPFSLLPRVLRKITSDQAEGIVIAPVWKNQLFWPMLTSMLRQHPVLLSSRESLLSQPSDSKLKHPLRKKLQLLVCNVSGISSAQVDFLRTLPTSSCHHGENPRKKCTTCTYASGIGTRVNGKWIQFRRL